MSRENVERAKRLLAAFNRRDVARLVEMTTDDYEFTPLTAGTLEARPWRCRSSGCALNGSLYHQASPRGRSPPGRCFRFRGHKLALRTHSCQADAHLLPATPPLSTART